MKFEVYCPVVKDFCIDGNAGKDSKIKCLFWLADYNKCSKNIDWRIDRPKNKKED